MTTALSDAEIVEALKGCADEPVHIPGVIQPFGCLIAAHHTTHEIAYASENASAFLGQSAAEILGKDARSVLGREAWHGVRNAAGRVGIDKQAITVGEYELCGKFYNLRVHRSADMHVIEIEPAMEAGLSGANALNTLTYLMAQVQNCETEQRLFDLTCEVMQHLSGYDRVLIYRFDAEFNGEVLAEVKRASFEGFLGLRFPHWDIPAQARAIMAKLPLRFIQDVEQVPVPILAAADAPPLDITLADARGVSPVHLEYLRNMGSAATMTLSVMIEGKLWGIISFHHSRPKVPAPGLRDVLVNFLVVFNGKHLALQQQMALKRIEALDDGFVGQGSEAQPVQTLIPSAAPLVMDVMKAHGLAALARDETVTSGNVPEPEVLRALTDLAIASTGVVVIESLAERFPEYAGKFGDAAGALAIGVLPDRAICIFRNEIQREVAWAGNPEKIAENVDGRLRLAPRGSFATFLSMVRGRCDPWSENDIYLIRHLRTLLHAAERQTMMDTLHRQQVLMIGELNHRVRNILALVRSVSRQARRRYGSLNSYASAIENRIRALAAAHDLSGGRSLTPVPIYALIQAEFEPFRTIADQQTSVTGPDWRLKPDMAPIFSLVVHELTTNAAKYGALSVAEGRVTVTLKAEGSDLTVVWRESDGPTVNHPNEHGFGMAMIEQAVPHELGGTADVRFEPEGVHAIFTLPGRHFTREGTVETHHQQSSFEPEDVSEIPEFLHQGTVMVLEDNFIIAKEMADQLADLGCADIRTAASVEAAMEIVEDGALSFAVLDVNLGAEQTSEPVAEHLTKLGVPFIFVSGYGEDIPMAAQMDQAPRLSKPITATEFLQALAQLRSQGA